jgi:hypothetical protein
VIFREEKQISKLPLGQEHITRRALDQVHAATPLLRLISILGAPLGGILLVGGIYLALGGGAPDTRFTLFGNEFSSTSVEVSMAFMGAAMIILTFLRILASVDHLAGLSDEDKRMWNLKRVSETIRALPALYRGVEQAEPTGCSACRRLAMRVLFLLLLLFCLPPFTHKISAS